MTVPPLGGGQDRAALAAGYVDADDGDVGGAAGRVDRLATARPGRGRRRPRPRRRAPASCSRSASAWCGTTPIVRAAPAAWAAARRQRPGLAGAADDGDRPGSIVAPPHHPARSGAGAPHTSITASDSSGGRSSGITGGDRAAEEDRRSRRPAPARCGRPSAARPSSITSGVRVSETSVATRSPTARPSGDSGPTSSTVPTSIPPEPGLGVLHLAAGGDDVEHRGADRVAVAVVGALELAERRGVEVEPLDPDPDLVGPQLAAGVEPLGGLRQHAGRREHAVQARPGCVVDVVHGWSSLR